jgi:hypothetical protein
MRVPGSSPTPIPPRSWPRPRSSSARCCRCSRAVRQPSAAATAAATFRWRSTLPSRSIRT